MKSGAAVWGLCAIGSVAIHLAGAGLLLDRPTNSEDRSRGSVSFQIGGLTNSVDAEPAPRKRVASVTPTPVATKPVRKVGTSKTRRTAPPETVRTAARSPVTKSETRSVSMPDPVSPDKVARVSPEVADRETASTLVGSRPDLERAKTSARKRLATAAANSASKSKTSERHARSDRTVSKSREADRTETAVKTPLSEAARTEAGDIASRSAARSATSAVSAPARAGSGSSASELAASTETTTATSSARTVPSAIKSARPTASDRKVITRTTPVKIRSGSVATVRSPASTVVKARRDAIKRKPVVAARRGSVTPSPVLRKTLKPVRKTVRTAAIDRKPEKVRVRRKKKRTTRRVNSRENGKGKAKARSSASRKGNASKTKRRASRSGSGGRKKRAGNGRAEANYGGRVSAHLRRHQRYPSAARRQRRQGKAVVRFRLSSSGRVLSVTIVRSSGHRDLDQATRQAVRRAQPFPRFPASITKRSMHFTVPIRFRL